MSDGVPELPAADGSRPKPIEGSPAQLKKTIRELEKKIELMEKKLIDTWGYCD